MAFVEVPVVSYRTLRDFLLVAIRNCIKYDIEAFYLTGLLGRPARLPLIEPQLSFSEKGNHPTKKRKPYQVVAVLDRVFPIFVGRL